MGASLTCVSCITRGDQEEYHEAKPVTELVTPRATTDEQQASELAASLASALVAVKSEPVQQTAATRSPDPELQDQINEIVNSRRKNYKRSPLRNVDNELQAQINAIVSFHTRSLVEQRQALGEDICFPSPSPAKSFSDDELGHYAHAVLSQAKARNTPGWSPPPMYFPWTACDSDVAPSQSLAPCQLDFSEFEHSVDVHPTCVFDAESKEFVPQAPSHSEVPEPAFAEAAKPKELEKSVDASDIHTAPFNVNDIPSPTRNRAKRQQMMLAAMDRKAADSSSKSILDDSLSLDEVHNAIEKNLDEVHREYLEKKMAEREAEKEASKKKDEGDEEDEETKQVEEAARLKEAEEARFRKEMEEKAEMAAMDKVCVNTFLASVKYCAWRERVRTPIKGTNLYTKHMRPARPMGTSVDVKDSNFRNLGTFLNFLENEGLLCVKPGLTDPVVTSINFDACRKYVYTPQCAPPVVKQAPHGPDCYCRVCLPLATRKWQ